MSATRTIIGDQDVVSLLNDVSEWAAGTEGTVLGSNDGETVKTVEVVDEQGAYLGSVLVPIEQLRLVAKCPHPPVIGTLDRVALLKAIDGWGIGTTGVVVGDDSTHKMLEITGYRGESLDFVDVPTEHLRLLRKCPRPDLGFARSRAMAAAERSTPPVIGEHDVVELLSHVDGWPATTSGTVLSGGPGHKLVEISDHLGEELDCLYVPTELLRLTWKCRTPASEIPVD
jgi:hypothetical protein